MALVIGLSGPQGGGKSTLLNGLTTRGIKVDDFKVSREVQSRLGWDTLDRVQDSAETMKEFQRTVLEVKKERERFNSGRDDVDLIVVERTFADIYVYTCLWADKLIRSHKWGILEATTFVSEIADECISAQKVYEANIFLPFMEHVKWESDPHRATQSDVEFVGKELEIFIALRNPPDVVRFSVTAESVQDRVDQVHNFIKTL